MSVKEYSSSIEIVYKGITHLDTEVVVNAANEHLLEGSGVCGYIFKAAGSKELAAECNKIGYCKTGSAVITSACKMKTAKYIIQAVGPRWHGGDNQENKKLYGTYYRSLELSKEYNCHSIAFPLISSGIFGYPVEKAWEKAIQTCWDFIKDNPSYVIRIVFAIVNESTLEIGKKILSNLISTPDDEITRPDVVGFYKIDEPNGYLSNWWKSYFVIDGKIYNCVEQYIMEQLECGGDFCE